MTYPSIQSLISVDPARSSGSSIGLDWDGSALLAYTINGSNTVKFNGLTGAELVYNVTVNVSGSGVDLDASPMAVGSNGHLLCAAENSLYAGATAILDQSTLDLITYLPYAAPNFGQGGMIAVSQGGVQFYIDKGVGNLVVPVLNRINFISDSTGFISEQDFPGVGGYICAGAAGSGAAWLMTNAYPSGGTQVALYKIQFTAPSTVNMTLVAAYDPSDIQINWVSNFGCGGVAFDQTDGKLITTWGGFGDPSINCRMVKLDPASGAIDWAVDMPSTSGGGPIIPGDVFSYSSIKNQEVAFWNGGTGPWPTAVIIYSTVDGSILTTLLEADGISGQFAGQQSYNDTIGALCFYGIGAAGGAGVNEPTPLNSTPSGWSNQWALLYVGTPVPPPEPPGRRFHNFIGLQSRTGGNPGVVNLRSTMTGDARVTMDGDNRKVLP